MGLLFSKVLLSKEISGHSAQGASPGPFNSLPGGGRCWERNGREKPDRAVFLELPGNFYFLFPLLIMTVFGSAASSPLSLPAPCCCMPSPSSSIKFGFCSRKQLGQATSE